MTSEMWTYDDVAKYVGVPKGTVYSWVRRRKIPFYRLGPRLVRFCRSEIETWLQARAVQPNEPKKGHGGSPRSATIH